MQLSPHFSLVEMTVTHTGLPNNPNDTQIAALTALCSNMLEPIRAHFGLPITINCGFRSTAVNRKVGGALDSQHLFGEAADIEIPGIENCEVWRWIVSSGLGFDQVIAETLDRADPAAGWVHVSYTLDRARRDAISFLGKSRGYVKGLQFVD